MAKNMVYIKVGPGGSVGDPQVHAQIGDMIVWLPETQDVKIDITFADKTPVGSRKLPLVPAKGKIVKAKVSTNPTMTTAFPYSVSTLREDEPEIIIDPGPALRNRKRKAPRKAAAKTARRGTRKR